MRYNFKLFLLFLLLLLSISTLKEVRAVDIPSLKEVYKDYFLIGAAVSNLNIYNYEDLLKKHFNSLTPENQMKWEVIHPRPNVYNFNDADEIVDFAMKNGMKVRGHTLVWHNQTPPWVLLEKMVV